MSANPEKEQELRGIDRKQTPRSANETTEAHPTQKTTVS